MRIAALPARTRGPLVFWALAGMALLVSHDAIFLAQLGPGEGLTRALRAAGHEYWGLASVGLVVIGLAAAAIVALRLVRLRRRASALGGRAFGDGSARSRLLAAWARLFALVGIGFMVQESLEHFGSHGHFLGPSALVGPEYPLAVPVIAIITLLGAVLAVAVGRAEASLLTAIADGLRRQRRAPRRLTRPALRLTFEAMRPMARATGVRAPPDPLVSPI